MKEYRIWQINDGGVMKESLWIRIKRLFGWKPKSVRENLRERFNRVRMSSGYQPTRTKDEVDKFMEKIINETKKVPYIEEHTGDYNLRFSLQGMTEDHIPELNTVQNAAPHKATADDIVNVVLAEISKTSKFSQDVRINFKMKSGWGGYIKMWLYPQIYYGESYGYKNDFSEIYMVENDPSFLNWESIYYSDANGEDYHPTYEIHLNTADKWDRYCSHYSGIWSVSWVEFLNKQKTSSPIGKTPKINKDDLSKEYMVSKFQKLPGIKKNNL